MNCRHVWEKLARAREGAEEREENGRTCITSNQLSLTSSMIFEGFRTPERKERAATVCFVSFPH